jgi:hypothetical protein
MPDMVPQACNPSYSGSGDRENGGLRPAWAKSLRDSSQSIAGHCVLCLLSQLCGKLNKRILVQAKMQNPIPKIIETKMGQGCGLNGKAAA